MHTDPVEETIELAGRSLTLLRPASADELIDEEAFDDDEFLPYWAELWPSGVALARAVGELDVRGARVLELGAGLGLPSLAAAVCGADVLATDWADDAVELLRLNAGRNRVGLRAERVRWDDPGLLLEEAPWTL
ncbi:MAG: class I SAM-dependent methyltransferase, partial [Gaiellaceae bacterium]